MDILLSICIPTYNRIKDLSEVIDSLLRVSSDAFEIVITDNCSTDSTEQTVCGYSDPRVRYCRNESPLPPFLNMIHSIFNGRGKYALYCNDRDLIYPEGVERLLTHLRDQDLAFVWGPAASGKNDGSLMRYTKGFDSLMHHACIHHPTGMIFNRTLIAAHLAEEEYAQFLPYVNTYDFLMLDLMQYGDTAILGNKILKVPPEKCQRNGGKKQRGCLEALLFSGNKRADVYRDYKTCDVR